MERHVRLAQRAPTLRRQGLGGIGFGTSIDAPHKAAKGIGRNALVLPDPPGLYIPAFDGNPDVGLLTPKASLTTWTGSRTFTSGTYENYIITGQVTISGNVTFNNCWIYGGTNYTIYITTGTLYMNDCEVGRDGWDSDRLVGSTGGAYVAQRCKLQYGEDGFKIKTNCVIRQCHILNLWTDIAGAHYDGIQGEATISGGALVEWSNVQGYRKDGGYASAAIIIKSDLGNQQDVIIRNNFLAGGGYTLRLRTDGTPYSLTGCEVYDNVFSNDHLYGYFTRDAGTTSVWTGNVNEDGTPIT